VITSSPKDKFRSEVRALKHARTKPLSAIRAASEARRALERELLEGDLDELRTALDDAILPEDRVLALINGMPQCLVSSTELRKAIVEALRIFWAHRFHASLPSHAELERHSKRLAKTVRKTLALLKDPKTTQLYWPDNERKRVHLIDEVPDILTGVVEMVEAAVREPNTSEPAMTALMRRLVAIYEQATGAPAVLPSTDPITGEVRGPLITFIEVAAVFAFEQQPQSAEAIRHRLRDFMPTGETAKKNSGRGLVQPRRGFATSGVEHNDPVAPLDETDNAESDRSAIDFDRRSGRARH
jgi:hypothetical protein